MKKWTMCAVSAGSSVFAAMRMMVVTAMLVVGLMSSAAHAQCGGRWLTSPEQVSPNLAQVSVAATMSNDDIVAGGSFGYVGGPAANYIARWNGFTWAPLGSGLDGGVWALKTLNNGFLIAGGSFVTANGGALNVNGIARWNGSTWSAIGSGVTGGQRLVYALAVLPNGNIVAGGNFTTASSRTTTNIARWTGSTWMPMGSGLNDDVYALAVMPNGDLIAAGRFTTAGGEAANYIARWNGLSWSPLGSGMNNHVYSLAVMPNGDLIAGGFFTTAGGATVNRIARWDGSAWSPLGSGMDGGVFALTVLANGDLIAGGSFAYANGAFVGYIAKWNGSLWSPLGSGLNDVSSPRVLALAVRSNGDLFAGGEITRAGNVRLRGIAQWNGSSWTTVGTGPSYDINGFAMHPDGNLVLGGFFTTAGGTVANNIARWNGFSLATYGSGHNTSIQSVAVRPNREIVAAGGSTSSFIAEMPRWNGLAWSGTGLFSNAGNAPVLRTLLALPNGDVVAGGFFISAGGAGASNISRWNGSSWSRLGSGVSGQVYSLASMPNGDLIVGGSFLHAGGTIVNGIARWNGSTWAEIGGGVSSPPSPNAVFVSALAVLPNGDLIVGGNFVSAGGVTANCIARWNGSSWSSMGSGVAIANFTPSVSALAVLPNGDIIAGGFFTEAGGMTANHIARWNGSSWTSLETGIGPVASNPSVAALAVHASGELIAGGHFYTAGGRISNYWARWTETGIPWVARQPVPQNVNAEETVALAAACASGYDFNGAVTYQWKRNGVNIVDGAGGASPGGGTVSGASGALPTPTTNPTATLTITGAQRGDAGEYTVVFANSCGGVTSSAAAVTVIGGCATDFNSDTVVDFFDYLDFVEEFAANGAAADFNADTVIDFFDYLDFVAAFSSGC